MIHIIKGDLLKSDSNFILHQANCESVMGKGIAGVIAKMFPLAAQIDKEFPYVLEERLGKYSIAKIKESLYIVNLYGQLYRGKPRNKEELKERYVHLENSLTSFLIDLKKKQKIEGKKYKVGIPYKIASDMAGGNWETVLEMLIEVSDKQNVDLYLYKKDKTTK